VCNERLDHTGTTSSAVPEHCQGQPEGPRVELFSQATIRRVLVLVVVLVVVLLLLLVLVVVRHCTTASTPKRKKLLQ